MKNINISQAVIFCRFFLKPENTHKQTKTSLIVHANIWMKIRILVSQASPEIFYQ